MKFGFYSGCREMLLSRNYTKLVDFIQENGYSSYEPVENVFSGVPTVRSLEEAREIRALMDSEGIACSCYSAYMDVYPCVEEAVERLMHFADISAALGSPFLHHTVYTPLQLSDGMPDYDSVLFTVKEGLTDVIKYAKALGVTVIYEPQGMFFNGVNGFGRLFHSLREQEDCEHIGVCFDFGNSVFVDCKPYDVLKELLPYVKHAHLKDYRYVKAELVKGRYSTLGGATVEDVEFGTGDMEAEKCIRLLENSGYQGSYNTESVPVASGLSAEKGGIIAMNNASKMNIHRYGKV